MQFYTKNWFVLLLPFRILRVGFNCESPSNHIEMQKFVRHSNNAIGQIFLNHVWQSTGRSHSASSVQVLFTHTHTHTSDKENRQTNTTIAIVAKFVAVIMRHGGIEIKCRTKRRQQHRSISRVRIVTIFRGYFLLVFNIFTLDALCPPLQTLTSAQCVSEYYKSLTFAFIPRSILFTTHAQQIRLLAVYFPILCEHAAVRDVSSVDV